MRLALIAPYESAIAAPNDERALFRKQLYKFQRLAATKRREEHDVRVELDAQISTLVTYWAATKNGQDVFSKASVDVEEGHTAKSCRLANGCSRIARFMSAHTGSGVADHCG
jgi:hypothetical protein